MPPTILKIRNEFLSHGSCPFKEFNYGRTTKKHINLIMRMWITANILGQWEIGGHPTGYITGTNLSDGDIVIWFKDPIDADKFNARFNQTTFLVNFGPWKHRGGDLVKQNFRVGIN